MALGDLTKQLVLDAMRQPDSPPVADSSGNVGATILGQVQAMQKALKDDQELVVLCSAGGETIRVLEFFLPSWQVAVLTGVDSGKSISRVISPVESLQLVCKVVKAAAKPTRINFFTPKPKAE
jgi:hypothetical protein